MKLAASSGWGQHPAGTPSNQRFFVSPDENTSQMRVPSHLSGLRCVLGAGLVRFRVNASPGASALRLRSVRPEPKNLHLQRCPLTPSCSRMMKTNSNCHPTDPAQSPFPKLPKPSPKLTPPRMPLGQWAGRHSGRACSAQASEHVVLFFQEVLLEV